MRFPLGRNSSIRIDFNGLMWTGLAIGGLGFAGALAKLLGAFPPDSRFEHLPFGVTLLGAALWAVGRIVQFWRRIRRSR